MNITYTPFTIDFYEQVIELWKKCEEIGLSGADWVDLSARYRSDIKINRNC